MKLRKCSLFSAVVGALIITAALAPRANAALIVYYNFEDAFPDFTSEAIGQQTPLLQTNYTLGDLSDQPGIALNVAAGDPDSNLHGLGLSASSSNDPSYFQFGVNTTFIKDMSLSFAINANGNGFSTVGLSYSVNGGIFVPDGTATILTSTGQIIAFTVPAGADGATLVTMRLTFSGAQSQGVNLQNVIDNIQLNGRLIPEPSTVVGGLLGACGLCWNQRRRLTRLLGLRRPA